MSESTTTNRTYVTTQVAAVPSIAGTAAPKKVEDVAAALKAKFGDSTVQSVETAHVGDPFIVLNSQSIAQAIQFLRDDERFLTTSLLVVGTIDVLPTKEPASPGRIEVVYVLYSYTHRFQLILKVFVERSGAVVPSIASLFRAANWYERECFDMMGVKFSGHPNLTRVLLPTDWVGYPLLKDYVFPEEYNGMKVPL
jgi:NADH-quinone oxidoreductase subunit C